MKKLIVISMATLWCAGLWAQSYNFESGVPAGFTVSGGTLDTTSCHYKDGTRSLIWTVSGQATMTWSGMSVSAASANASVWQMYLPYATCDTLVVEFKTSAGVEKRTATLICNYKGWREINRLYKEYSSTATFSLGQMVFTLKPASEGTRYICFDAVNLNASIDANRVPGCMWVADNTYLKTNNTPLTFYKNRPDLPLTTPTQTELKDLETVKSRVKAELSYNSMAALTAKKWVEANIKVSYNEDGTPRGTIIDNSGTALLVANITDMLNRLQALAAAKYAKVGDDYTKAFDNYLNQLLDQGFAEGGNMTYASNSYNDPRTVIPALIYILPACDSLQADEVCKLAKWVSQYYCMYYSENTCGYNNNSDIMYLFGLYYQQIASQHPNKVEAVREMYAVKRFLDRYSTSTEGAKEIIKPDGSGFHHNSHYIGYMYSYFTFTSAISNVRGTCYQISEQGYRNFYKALTAIYDVLTPSTGDSRHFCLALAGRHPFGTTYSYNLNYWKQLVEAGASYPKAQNELKSLCNYFYQKQVYAGVSDTTREGYHAYNWSPIGVMRHGNWVAVMRAPTAKFWTGEIYSGTNRFGRYQAHGALHICYGGANMGLSGYPIDGQGGGWNWNVNPGTTTVHYTSWQTMMPKGNTTQRFDQYAKSTNFSGATGFDNVGVWACEFDQLDTWGSQCFTPTNLKFHKSVFTFDTLMVAIGSDIEASGNYGDDMITATNIDQTLVTALKKNDFYVDGEAKALGYKATLDSAKNHWMIFPTSTGYYIPRGNDSIYVQYASQKGPKQTGADYANPTTSANVALAYMNHGVKTAECHYQYVVLPGQTPAKMSAIAAAYDKQLPYKVLADGIALHAVQCGNTTAYAVFMDFEDSDAGILKSASHQHLFIHQLDSTTALMKCSAVNPNLEPKADSYYSWLSQPTSTTNVLYGDYELVGEPEGVELISDIDSLTTIKIDFKQGLEVKFVLKDKNIQPKPSVVPFVEADATPIRKILRDGQLLILKDNKQFSVLGEEL